MPGDKTTPFGERHHAVSPISLTSILEPPIIQDKKGERPELVDSSGPLYAMYREMTEDEDTKMAERWNKDAEGVLIFTGLFSAAVAALIAVTILDLKQNPQDESNFYLKNIYQILGDSNVSHPSIPFTSAELPKFSPPKYVIWQWARRYIKVTQLPRYHDDSPHYQARIREYFFQGADKCLSWVVEVLPPLIHISLFLFFTGLLIYLFNLNHTVFCAVVCPYYSSLSPLAYSLSAVILYLVLRLFCCIFYCCRWVVTPRNLRKYYHDRFSQGREKMIKTTVDNLSMEIDSCILKSVIHAPIDDHTQDRLFQCILGFCSSKVVTGPNTILRNLSGRRLSSILITYLERTWSSNVVPEPDKIQRFVKCVKVVDMARLSDVVLRILRDIFTSDNHMVLRSVEIGHSLRSRSYRSDQEIGLCARLVVAGIIANGNQSDGSWIALARDQLGEDLMRYREHGRDSVLLANLIHLTRLIFDSFSDGLDIGHRISYIVLSSRKLPAFDIHNTLPELQRDFRALWNIISEASRHREPDDRFIHVLNCIRDIYSDLNASNDTAPTALTPTPPFVAPTSTMPAPGSAYLPVLVSALTHLNNSPSLPRPAAGHAGPYNPRSLLPISTSPPSVHVQPVRSADLLALLSGTPVSWPTGHKALPRLHARGLVNKGNMCFANAVLQLLVHSPPFWELFRELGRLMNQRDDQESGGVQTPLLDATVRFLEKFVCEEREAVSTQLPPRGKAKEEDESKCYGINSVDPTYMHDTLAMKQGNLSKIMGGGQQDAAEFLHLYLDVLHDEFLVLLASIKPSQLAYSVPRVEESEDNKAESQPGEGWTEVGKREEMVLTCTEQAKSVESPISRIFGCKLPSTSHTPHQHGSPVVDNWWSLRLDINHASVYTIQDALTHTSQLQAEQVGSSGSNEGSQQGLIEPLPPVLILHLEHFQNRTEVDVVKVKINKRIQLSPELDIPLDVMAPAARRPTQPPRYTLYGVLYHHGASVDSGHYTIDVLHQNRDGSGEGWLHIDDRNVSAIQHRDVFWLSNERTDDRCAYLLFYRRAAPT